MQSPDDASLLRDYCATRSEDAFTQLVRRHLPLVYHSALRRLNSPALAEEAAQNAFTRLAAKASAVSRHPERLRAWLHRSAFLEACTLARREARLSRLPLPPDSSAMHRPEIYDRLDEALNALPELDREVILRKYGAGEDYRRIAAEVGKSEAACQKRVERGLLRLSESLGSATAVTAIAAALTAGAGKASALPAAGRIATTALENSAGSSAAAGAWTGLATAVCVAAALSGGTLGWRQEREVPSAPAPPHAVERPAVTASGMPRQPVRHASAPFTGTLDEVLESIRAGRLGPLIDFLPRATAADLRTIVNEEDYFGLGEGSPPEKPAHRIAFQHWTETDPATAFAWAVPRDRENTGRGMPRTSRVLPVWLKVDRAAAVSAFVSLPLHDRAQLIASLSGEHDALADALAQQHPGLFWDLARSRYWRELEKPPGENQEDDDKRIAAILAGEREPGSTDRSVTDVFTRLAFRNPDAALEQAAKIPAPGLREVVLQELRPRFVPLLSMMKLEQLAATLPPGLDRTRATAALFKNLASSQPAEALRRLRTMPPGLERDAALAQAGSVLSSTDPWALLETLAALRGPINSPGGRVNADGVHGGFGGLTWDYGATGRALQFALQDDPARALKLMPEIQIRQPNAGFAVSLASAWAETDLPAAIHWVAGHGSSVLRNDFWIRLGDYEPKDGGTEIIAMLPAASDKERELLHRAIGSRVEAAVMNDSAPEILQRLAAEDADAILSTYADWTSASQDIAGALRFAALVSPSVRTEKVLPEIALNWLRYDETAAVDWITTLRPTERAAVLRAAAKNTRLSESARTALSRLNP